MIQKTALGLVSLVALLSGCGAGAITQSDIAVSDIT
jgi:hypothetical protein